MGTCILWYDSAWQPRNPTPGDADTHRQGGEEEGAEEMSKRQHSPASPIVRFGALVFFIGLLGATFVCIRVAADAREATFIRVGCGVIASGVALVGWNWGRIFFTGRLTSLLGRPWYKG